MGKFRVQALWLIAILVLQFTANGQEWRTKPADQWSEADAKQLLTASPWVKTVKVEIARRETEDELRSGGKMGQPTGPGYDGVDQKTSGARLPTNIFTPSSGAIAHYVRKPLSVTLRWESALPVRLAELKSREVEPPTSDSDGYCIAVYGVPGDYYKDGPKKLGDPLKDYAFLKREGKKDVKPTSVEVFQREDGLVVVYVFPFSAEISKRDTLVRFQANIGRVVVDYSFDVSQMEFQGKLEL